MDELNTTVARRPPSRLRSAKRYGRPLKRRIRSYNPDIVGVYSTSGPKFKGYRYTYRRRYVLLSVLIRTNRFKTRRTIRTYIESRASIRKNTVTSPARSDITARRIRLTVNRPSLSRIRILTYGKKKPTYRI